MTAPFKRWLVVTESYGCLSPGRYSFEQYASLGAAQDRREAINAEAIRHEWKIRASLVDQKKSAELARFLLTHSV
jgi:hypothetical protein